MKKLLFTLLIGLPLQTYASTNEICPDIQGAYKCECSPYNRDFCPSTPAEIAIEQTLDANNNSLFKLPVNPALEEKIRFSDKKVNDVWIVDGKSHEGQIDSGTTSLSTSYAAKCTSDSLEINDQLGSLWIQFRIQTQYSLKKMSDGNLEVSIQQKGRGLLLRGLNTLLSGTHFGGPGDNLNKSFQITCRKVR